MTIPGTLLWTGTATAIFCHLFGHIGKDLILLHHISTKILQVLLSSRPSLGREDPWGHLMKVLALALAPQVLALTLTSKEKSWPWPSPQDLCHVVVVHVCSAHTHSVTWQSAISCLGMLQRLACELDVGCKIIRVCEVRAAVWCQYI